MNGARKARRACGHPPFILILAGVAFFAAAPSQAQIEPPDIRAIDLGTIGLAELELLSPSSVFRPMDMIGVRAGARGWGMGGALVADARGLEGIAYNPAGVAWLSRRELTADLVWTRSSGSTTGFPESFDIPDVARLFVTRYEVNLKSRLRYEILGAGTSTRTFAGGRLAGALSFRRYLDVTYPEEVLSTLVVGGADDFPVTFAMDGNERGGVDATAATVAYQVVPDVFALGGNLNYLDGRLRADRDFIVGVGGAANSSGLARIQFDYKGLSADIGAQARVQDRFAVGLRYTPGFTLEVTKGRYYSRSVQQPGQPLYIVSGRVAGYDMDVPSLLSLGVWTRPIPRISLAADWNRQNWSEAKISYRDGFATNGPTPDLPLRDVTSIHIGAEARYLRFHGIDLPVRAGYRQGPLSTAQLEPRGAATSEDWAGGDVDTKGYSFGLGFESGEIRYDLSYDILDYTLKKFYFDSATDPFINPNGVVVNVDRRVTLLRLTATLSL